MKIRIFLIYIIYILLNIFIFFYVGYGEGIIDDDTKLLCRWYANIDHRKEIDDLRYEIMSYRWTDFDWYSSCINHVKRSYEITKTN